MSGLTPEKKALLKQLMGSYSGKVDLNKIREYYKEQEFFKMIFDREYCQETYDYYDSIYEENEDEKEIFESWQNRRNNLWDIAEKNTKRNSDGLTVISKDDPWRDE